MPVSVHIRKDPSLNHPTRAKLTQAAPRGQGAHGSDKEREALSIRTSFAAWVR